jgi:hypothetical protein
VLRSCPSASRYWIRPRTGYAQPWCKPAKPCKRIKLRALFSSR